MCIHKWEKWEIYEVIIPERRISNNYAFCTKKEYRQRKRCSKCGKVKDRLINTVSLG